MLTSLLNEGSCSLLCSITANHAPMSLSCQLTVRNIFISCSASIVFIDGSSHYKEDNTDRHNNRLHIVLFSRWHSLPCATPHGETKKKKFLFFVSYSSMTLNNYGMSARLIEMSYQQESKVNKFCSQCTRLQVVEVPHVQPICLSQPLNINAY